uniref:CNH domain-containing protein n=1 Tax=Panagrolaimus superbus TaxID=310955 RepID=A0A914XX23_9BILA
MFDAYVKADSIKGIYDITAAVAHASKESLFACQKGALIHLERQHDSSRQPYTSQAYRNFEKHTVRDMQFIESLDLILCFVNGQVSAHRCKEPFDLVAVINQYTPINAFAANVFKKTNKLYVIISAKRQLHVFKFILNKFEEVPISLNPATLLDNPSIIRWVSEYSVYYALKTEFSFVQLWKNEENPLDENIGMIHTVAPRTSDAPLVLLSDLNVIGLCRNSTMEFYDSEGARHSTIPNAKFSEQPFYLAYQTPYLLATVVRQNIIEVRSIQPSMLVQKISIDRPSLLCPLLSGIVYAIGGSTIFELDSRPPLKENIRQLVRDKQFDLACRLTDKCDTISAKEKTDVKRKTAASLFAQKRFEECFEIHKKEKTDILLILQIFFPSLIPEKFRVKAQQYSKEANEFMACPDFAVNEWKQAENELSDFLSEMRTEHAKILDQHRQKIIELSTSEFKHHENILELADTVLLKCYLKNRPSMVPSLLRLSHNHCNVEETARDLYNVERFDDLFLLYSKKNMRRKALEILKIQSKKEESLLYGLEEAVKYMQSFGPSNFDLIKEYSIWILNEEPEWGVKIFATNDTEIVKQLPREQVLSFLRSECVAAVIPYLEHIIFKWRDEKPSFHEELAGMYISKVKKLMTEYVHVLSENERIPQAGEEEGELGIYRKKLIHFLNYSNKYNPNTIDSLLNDILMQERAIIYGRLGRHEEALLIYANVLMDYELAEEHCEKYYNDKNQDVFVILFKAYTNPTLLPSFSTIKRIRYSHPKISEALNLLTRHPTQIDPVEALHLLPEITSLRKVWPALEAVMEAIKNKASALEIHVALTKLDVHKKQASLRKMKSEKVEIDYNVICFHCEKPIDSAFVKFKNGKLAHYSCHMRQSGDTPSTPTVAAPIGEKRLSQRHRTVSLL